MRFKNLIIFVMIFGIFGFQTGFSGFWPKSNAKKILPLENSPYSMELPKGWEVLADPEQLPAKVKLICIGTGKKQFTPSINLAVEAAEMEPDQYFALAKQYHESLGETVCAPLGVLQTNAGTAHMFQIDRKTTWGNVRFLQAILMREGMAYVITATSLQEEYASFYPYFFRAIQSFNLKHEG